MLSHSQASGSWNVRTARPHRNERNVPTVLGVPAINNTARKGETGWEDCEPHSNSQWRKELANEAGAGGSSSQPGVSRRARDSQELREEREALISNVTRCRTEDRTEAKPSILKSIARAFGRAKPNHISKAKSKRPRLGSTPPISRTPSLVRLPSINREKSNETFERTPSASKHAMITRTASAQMDVDFQGMQVHC